VVENLGPAFPYSAVDVVDNILLSSFPLEALSIGYIWGVFFFICFLGSLKSILDEESVPFSRVVISMFL